eukprot:INCI1829.1.p1 GENE.INCI1829.1~~INCI1829.1.p1  ORF type:complete len:118 (+),score=1.87 INCI1829.1:202-555(+)
MQRKNEKTGTSALEVELDDLAGHNTYGMNAFRSAGYLSPNSRRYQRSLATAVGTRLARLQMKNANAGPLQVMIANPSHSTHSPRKFPFATYSNSPPSGTRILPRGSPRRRRAMRKLS